MLRPGDVDELPAGDERRRAAAVEVQGVPGAERDERLGELGEGQAGVVVGAPVARDGEGFSAGRRQFDSDITDGRYPRAAFGYGDGKVFAVACDGRAATDAGMTLAELARFMAALGCERAINLDGGGSTSLVCGGVLVNRPREEHGIEIAGGRPVCTALALLPRA